MYPVLVYPVLGSLDHGILTALTYDRRFPNSPPSITKHQTTKPMQIPEHTKYKTITLLLIGFQEEIVILMEIPDFHKKQTVFFCATARVDPRAKLFTQHLSVFPGFVILFFVVFVFVYLQFCVFFVFALHTCHSRYRCHHMAEYSSEKPYQACTVDTSQARHGKYYAWCTRRRG